MPHPALKPQHAWVRLEDFATGIRDADAMLGKLTEYFSQVDEPVILVFWGDHYNPIDSNYDVFTKSGYASDSSADPPPPPDHAAHVVELHRQAGRSRHHCGLRYLAGDDEHLRPEVSRSTSST